jgi:hypothetical protein
VHQKHKQNLHPHLPPDGAHFNIFPFYTLHASPMSSTLLPNFLDSLTSSIF